MWIFGYGSLIWKVDFPYEKRAVGYIKGFERKFYQYSVDHRGTPENPGRVVTLIPSKDKRAQVWGIAYKIRDFDVLNVLNHLDYREKGGYKRIDVTFYPECTNFTSIIVDVYIGFERNKNYAGEADDLTIASQIVNAVGPSGPNVEYVCKLAEAIRSISPSINDEHLFSIETKVLGLINKSQNDKKLINFC